MPASSVKILIIGDSSCGKTSILHQFVHGKFEESYKATVACEFALKILKVDDISIRLNLWDIAGQDRLGGISNLFCRDAAGALVLTDINIPETLDNAVQWKHQVDLHLEADGSNNIPMVLAVNKYDLIEEDEKVGSIKEENTEQYLKEFAKKNKFSGVFRTSAKTGKNVTATFSKLVYEILKHQAENDEETTTRDTKVKGESLVIPGAKPKRKKNCDC
ncbi:unnamed protein product [Moneuplotes crassus]|uniref:Ras-related protein Rab n=1 Tax=Euplotes crassus TaxID=5936 RepID=A0AAD1XY33_EUPCR|nr:unnamed protein product [Moneuplotes crassus]